ncbi:c-type cytochrome [Proteobacteria bacterium 005FR1]|nr:c-type cytochrome [Proteobacteria bacterium 005FR1]
MRIFLLTLVALAAIGAAIGLWVIYSGAYNVAATEPHTAFGRWILHTTMENSVRERAEQIDVPELTAEMADRGFDHFDSHCKVCHGAPGVEPAPIGRGLRPEPPALSDAVTEWQPSELFWIVEHGIQMTGMPAWGQVYSDDEIWDLVAFTVRLPYMSESEYRDYQQADQPQPGLPAAQPIAANERNSDTDQFSQPTVVEMTDKLKYVPAKITIQPGGTVEWRNTSSLVHTVTADAQKASDKSHVKLPPKAGSFDSGNIQPGGSYRKTFDVPGQYRYFCIPHEAAGMIGEITVVEN